ncbi:hypothetical protein GQ54DRAFT_57681 [Martensiomyces pterosporus]|nr:hypothetical protein GQ54DRAFT_57681 [Martensiomyces pterosporus]
MADRQLKGGSVAPLPHTHPPANQGVLLVASYFFYSQPPVLFSAFTKPSSCFCVCEQITSRPRISCHEHIATSWRHGVCAMLCDMVWSTT